MECGFQHLTIEQKFTQALNQRKQYAFPKGALEGPACIDYWLQIMGENNGKFE